MVKSPSWLKVSNAKLRFYVFKFTSSVTCYNKIFLTWNALIMTMIVDSDLQINTSLAIKKTCLIKLKRMKKY